MMDTGYVPASVVSAAFTVTVTPAVPPALTVALVAWVLPVSVVVTVQPGGVAPAAAE
jgi:hypothetical protein